MSASTSSSLLTAIEGIDRPGAFCTGGLLPVIHPGLEVSGVGPVSLPLSKEQAAQLKRHSHQAPYGKGTKTVVDTDVRRVWEIDGSQVHFANREWPSILEQAVEQTRNELGLQKEKLTAHLYKLLLYEKGSFFLPHRDGEKLDRMVATLVIVLPSAHREGQLIVRHEGREVTYDFAPESPFQIQFAAFYADCEHEVRRLASGYRLTLVYNLTLEKSKKPITAPVLGVHVENLARILQTWANGESEPHKLAVLLDHEYSKAGLVYDALKGTDRAKAEALFAAAERAGSDASLALVTYWETGTAEPIYDGRSYRRGRYGRGSYYGADDSDNGDRHTMGEIIDSGLSVESFSDREGSRLDYGQMPLEEEEIVSRTPLAEGKPDEENFEGYTGNAGMTLERWYRRAALVLWPSSHRYDMICDTGIPSAVRHLGNLVRQWGKAPKSRKPALNNECTELAIRIMARWPRHEYPSSYARAESEKAEPSLLSLLDRLGEIPLIARWIREVVMLDATVDPVPELGAICQRFGWTTFEPELRELYDATTEGTLVRNARLLADLSLRKPANADRRNLCTDLAHRLMPAVERWNPAPSERDWRRRPVELGQLLPPLVQSFLILKQPDLMERLATNLLGRTDTFHLTDAQVPVLLELAPWLKRHLKRNDPGLHHWLTAMREELEPLAANPPMEPQNARRDSAIPCTCNDCRQLSQFLDDPRAQELHLKMVEHRRRHLHEIITRNKLDTTHVTARRGSPYTLVCTKTKASYLQALEIYNANVEKLRQVRELLAWQDNL